MGEGGVVVPLPMAAEVTPTTKRGLVKSVGMTEAGLWMWRSRCRRMCCKGGGS